MFNETHSRSAVKAISYRIMMTITTVAIVYFVTGAITKALTIGGLEIVVKTILYFVHERLWNSIEIGKEK